MSDFNPYAPPKAELLESEPPTTHPIDLADRRTRFFASLLDGLIVLAPIGLIAGVCYFLWDWNYWEEKTGYQRLWFEISSTILALAVFFAVNGRSLSRDGQTLGKRIFKIRIVKEDGRVPDLKDSFLKRQALMTVLQSIPFIGGIISLIDALLIFRENRKCLHDEFAGTIVVKVH